MAGVRFKETMDGYFGENIRNFRDGEDFGIRNKSTCKFVVTIDTGDIDKFTGISHHEARLTGKFICTAIGGEAKMSMKKGKFNLFVLNSSGGYRQMRYRFNFTAPDGKLYYFTGYKDIHNDPGFDIIDDLTTLYVRIFEGGDENGRMVGSGMMYFRIK